MDPEPLPSAASLQATLFDFALSELVRRHRQSFAPLWTIESWSKLLIWLALSCGCSGDGRGLEAFAAAFDAVGLSARVTADRQRWQSLDALMAVPWQSGDG